MKHRTSIFLSFKNVNIFFILGFFSLLYNPPLLRINTMHIVGFISICFLLFDNSSFLKTYIKPIRSLFKPFLLCLFYLLLISFINGHSIRSSIFPLFFIVDIIPFALVICNYTLRTNRDISFVINTALLASAIQVVLVFLAFLFPNIQQQYLSMIVDIGGYNESFLSLDRRAFALTGQSSFAMPILHSIFAILVLNKAANQRKAFRRIFLLFFSILLFFSAAINARTSILVFIIGIVISIINRREIIKTKTRILLYIVASIAAIFFIILPFVFNLSENTLLWIMEGADEVNELSKGSNTGTFSILLDKSWWKLPDSFICTIFGKGSDVLTGFKGYNSDVGYINDIWLGGLVFCFFAYTYVYNTIKRFKKSKNKTIYLIGILYIVILPIVNIKGPAFRYSSFTAFFIIISVNSFIIDKCRLISR